MSYADQVFMQNIREILDHGVWDTDQNVRPHWEDGTPAHTIKKFGIVNRYDLQKEFPILTLRRTYWKTAVDELLWIWQKKSNNVHGEGQSGLLLPERCGRRNDRGRGRNACLARRLPPEVLRRDGR